MPYDTDMYVSHVTRLRESTIRSQVSLSFEHLVSIVLPLPSRVTDIKQVGLADAQLLRSCARLSLVW